MIKNKPYPYYNIPKVSTFREYLNQCQKDYSNKPAISFSKNNMLIKKSYIEVNSEVKAVASKLISEGYSQDKMAILGENSYEWILSYFGITTSKNIVVPIDKALPIEQVEYIVIQTKSKVLFYSNAYNDYAKQIKKDIKNVRLINFDNEFEQLLNDGKKIYKSNRKIYENVKILPKDLAAIIYTSGTTGTAKGVMLTHNNICSNYVGGRNNLTVWVNSILVLPLHHTYAFTGAILCVMGCGTEIYINKSLKSIMSDMQEQKPHLMTLVPLMLETFHKRIWAKAKEGKKDKILKALIKISNMLLIFGIDVRRKLFRSVLDGFGGNLEVIICGGAPLDERYVKDFRAFGIQIIQGYGITECSPMLAVTRNYYFKDKAVGLKLPNVDIKINRFEDSQEGEILAKGENVMLGYYNDPELTKKVFDEEGYFKTGDVGYIDKDNFVYITGRIKNMIILDNGKNVYPEELEFELLKNDTIKEALVYEENKKIIAEVFLDELVIKDKKIESKDSYYKEFLLEFNKKQPFHKNIDEIRIREDEFPKTTSMKIKRKYLK